MLGLQDAIMLSFTTWN